MNIWRAITVFLIILIIIPVAPGVILSDEVSEVWTRVYLQTKTLEQKYEVMQNIIELDNRDMIPLLIQALDDLNSQNRKRSKSRAVLQKELKILIIKELGDLKVTEAAAVIYKTMKESQDPYSKKDALIALGEIGAKSYTSEIAKILRNLSLYRGADVSGDDSIAYGCILALEMLKEPKGYRSVFFASLAGFSPKVTEMAENALPNIVEDPTKILKEIMLNESSLKIKLEALKAVKRSGAPDENKIDLAVEALNLGLSISPSDVGGQSTLIEMRRTAMEMFITYEADKKEAVPLIEKTLYMNVHDSEKVFALEALRVMSNDDAANTLNRFLTHQIDREMAGVSARDNRMIIATVRAMGNANCNVGTRELMQVQYAGYPSTVVREAEKALKSLE